MSLFLKKDGDPAWLPPKAHYYSGTVILLQGDDGDVPGQPVDVPADLLLAVSPLVRSILSAGHLPPAYHQPVIILPSVSCQVLQTVRELFVSGMVSADTRTKVRDIQSVFKMLGIGVELICDEQPREVKVEVENRVYSDPACGVKYEFIKQIKNEKNEYFEDVNFEDACSRFWDQHQIKSSAIVKAEPDSYIVLTDNPRRPTISIPTPVTSPTSASPGSEALPVANNQAKFRCNFCKKKFVKAKELSKHASEQHNNKKPFHCFSCRFSARKYSEILEHRRLNHIDQFVCEPCGKLTFKTFAQFKKHKAWHKYRKQPSKIGSKRSCGLESVPKD